MTDDHDRQFHTINLKTKNARAKQRREGNTAVTHGRPRGHLRTEPLICSWLLLLTDAIASSPLTRATTAAAKKYAEVRGWVKVLRVSAKIAVLSEI